MTSGEIVCVLARTSADVTALPVLLATLLALALPWLLVALTTLSVLAILSLQLALFVALATILCLPRIRVALLPKATRRAIAHRAAMCHLRGRPLAAFLDHRRRDQRAH